MNSLNGVGDTESDARCRHRTFLSITVSFFIPIEAFGTVQVKALIATVLEEVRRSNTSRVSNTGFGVMKKEARKYSQSGRRDPLQQTLFCALAPLPATDLHFRSQMLNCMPVPVARIQDLRSGSRKRGI